MIFGNFSKKMYKSNRRYSDKDSKDRGRIWFMVGALF